MFNVFIRRYLYAAKLPEQLSSRTELKDLTKLSTRYNSIPLQRFIKLFDSEQFEEDDEEEVVCNGGFVDGPDPHSKGKNVIKFLFFNIIVNNF